jgi:subtilisin family serine protease
MHVDGGLQLARTIVYVHGIGNKPIPSVLKCQWDHALFGFDLGERSRLAYWVNRAFYPTPLDATCASGDLSASDSTDAGPGVRAFGPPPSIEAEVASLTANRKESETLIAIAEKLVGSVAEPPPSAVGARGVGAKALPLPRFLRELLTRHLVSAFLRDVNDYFYDDARRQVMRESVLERLRVGGGPFIVIGHSQGSMVAYDVLSSEEARDFEIPLFITIGSPLGIQEVRDQVKRLTKQAELKVPACVGHWLNVADPLDPVALDKRLSGDYVPAARIEDELEINPDSPRHPHSGTGYLRTEPVRRTVRELVDTSLFQPVASFRLARDVARELEDQGRTARHKVMLELVTDGGDERPLDDVRAGVVAFLRELEEQGQRAWTKEAQQARARGGTQAPPNLLRVQEMERWVSADLTREETELLVARQAVDARHVYRVWRNAAKRALLDKSVYTVQAHTAHLGYNALGQGIEWAVLDTGVRADHPHLAKSVQEQWDCTKLGKPVQGEAPDAHGHGTHVAGIIAGRGHATDPKTHARREFTGVAPDAKLHVYKVLDDEGNGEDAWIIKALDHIARTNERAGKLRIQGVNLSLGGSFDQSVFGCGHTPLCVELRRLWRSGVLVVLAAGNEGFARLQTEEGLFDANMDLSIGDPANLDEAIAVGSVHKENPYTYGISYFSSRGPTADGRQKPDLVAPGERIVSCRYDRPARGGRVEDLYVEMSGTSMAAPHVSGILAAFLSARREFVGRPDEVKQILLESCSDLRRDRPMQGAGLPNLTKMLLNR